MTATAQSTGETERMISWQQANQGCLETALHRLRLLLQRRIRWLRPQWQNDPLQPYQSMVISDNQADRLLSGEDRTGRERFYQEDTDAAALTQSIKKIEQILAERRAALLQAGQPSTLDVLVRLFGLTPFEVEVLILCLAPAVDPAFRRLYGYVQDDPGRQYVTPHLALTLQEEAPADETGPKGDLDVFLPGSRLRHYGLAEVGSGDATVPLSSSPLIMDERMVAYVLGRNLMDERIEEWVQWVPSAPLATAHREWVDRLVKVLARETTQGVWPVLNLLGSPAAGQSAVAKGLCDRLGLHLFRLDPARLPAQTAERRTMIRLLAREAVLMQLAIYIDATGLEAADRDLKQAVDDLVHRLPGPLFLASRERWPTQRELLSVRMPQLNTGDQLALWKGALSDVPHHLNGHVPDLVQQFHFSPETIAATVDAARRKARLRDSDPAEVLIPADMWEACREASTQQLDQLCQHLVPCASWEDLVLPEPVLGELKEVAAQVAHRTKVYEQWGFGPRMSRGHGISALFSGASGTGKTMAAEILAGHLKLDLYRIDLASMVSKYIGETEKNLKKVFDAAEQNGAILFFDEADALFGKRTEVKDSHDRYANIEIDYLLQRMEAYRGLAILATNRKTDLDKAFLRRLRFVIHFPFPDAKSRQSIWRKTFPPDAPLEDIDFEFLGRLEIPGGNIRNIALNAAFLAAEQNSAIRMEHLLQSARREYDKIEKLITRTEFGPYYRQVTA